MITVNKIRIKKTVISFQALGLVRYLLLKQFLHIINQFISNYIFVFDITIKNIKKKKQLNTLNTIINLKAIKY